jgi:hypothetical protein
MLEAAWEGHATTFANAATTDDFIDAVDAFMKSAKIDLSKPSRVVYGRDTRPSGPALVAALEDGFKAIGVEARDAGVTTTPILHYLVRAINTKGTKESYGEDSEDGYLVKLTSAFKKLVVGIAHISILQRLTQIATRQGSRDHLPLSSIAPTELARRQFPNFKLTWETASSFFPSIRIPQSLARSTTLVVPITLRHPRNCLPLWLAISSPVNAAVAWTAMRTA